MVELTLHHPGEHLFIRGVEPDGFHVADQYHAGGVIVSATDVVPGWPPRTADELQAEHLEAILALQPEVVLIGTGASQVFLSPELAGVFQRRNVGFEVMTTRAAARTFNVLVSEYRPAVCALMPLSGSSAERPPQP